MISLVSACFARGAEDQSVSARALLAAHNSASYSGSLTGQGLLGGEAALHLSAAALGESTAAAASYLGCSSDGRRIRTDPHEFVAVVFHPE